MKIYISGAITGITEPETLFKSAENFLRERGDEPINPMTLPHNHDKSWRSYMKEDIKALLDCDGIFLLKNWIHSTGANIEFHIANGLDMVMEYE